ncbi:MAG TPA: D-alanyl-D-alanine carboxypeptidase family protein [Burkholderiales bacterium]|nr:D-alanyl-D-alanine carboxypeptidase family protein [Burkholderiales bacterium]
MLRKIFLAIILLTAALAQAAAPPPPSVNGRAWLLADLSSGQILASENAEARFEPASLTKLMTAYVVFGALRDKRITLEQQANVSERAWKAPGSRMFIEPRKPVAIDELLRGMVVQSGNDASIALAEAVAGSEDLFVTLMNQEAERIGLQDTKFMNASGLPDPQHLTTARDLYRLTAALIRDFPDAYARYYAKKEYRYNNITQLNRNRLLWLDPSVDGVKTGHTEAAGYCLIASSRRGERRLLSVLLGSTSEAVRAQESLKLLNWGYQFFDSVKLYAKGRVVKTIAVWKGEAKQVNAGFAGDLVLTVPKGKAVDLKAELLSRQPLMAPVMQAQPVGTLRVSLDGEAVGEYKLIALEAVPAAGFFGRTWDTLRLWFK